jgi:hypothetical protein
MPERRFPPPWALAYVYFQHDAGQRGGGVRLLHCCYSITIDLALYERLELSRAGSALALPFGYLWRKNVNPITATSRLAFLGILIAASFGAPLPASAGGPTASVQAEYLMTYHANIAPPQAVDQNLLIVNVPGGLVDGPRIKGKLVAPGGDWLRVMPTGVLRLDVRATIQTDDNELIYVSFNGVIQCSKEQSDRLNAGEELKAGDCHFIIAPTFETKSEKYGWINAVQAVGKMVTLKGGDHVDYEIFAVK